MEHMYAVTPLSEAERAIESAKGEVGRLGEYRLVVLERRDEAQRELDRVDAALARLSGLRADVPGERERQEKRIAELEQELAKQKALSYGGNFGQLQWVGIR